MTKFCNTTSKSWNNFGGDSGGHILCPGRFPMSFRKLLQNNM